MIAKVQAWSQEKLGGSGDPELEDAVDVLTYFTKMFNDQQDVFKKLLESVLARGRAMDTPWVRPTCDEVVPEAPLPGQTCELCLAPWSLGFTKELRRKLWFGVPVTSAPLRQRGSAFTGDAARSAFTGDAARAKQPTEMTVSSVWADMDTTVPDYCSLLANFIKKNSIRMLKIVLREKVYFLDGWKEEEFSSKMSPPTYDQTSFVATFPSASAHLPFRQEWLTLQEGKFKDATLLSAFKSMVSAHDAKHNPSQVPYAGEESKKRKALEDQKKPEAQEIPHEEGDPTTKDEFLSKNNGTLVIQVFGQEFMFTTKAQLWVWGLIDDVVPADEPLGVWQVQLERRRR